MQVLKAATILRQKWRLDELVSIRQRNQFPPLDPARLATARGSRACSRCTLSTRTSSSSSRCTPSRRMSSTPPASSPGPGSDSAYTWWRQTSMSLHPSWTRRKRRFKESHSLKGIRIELLFRSGSLVMSSALTQPVNYMWYMNNWIKLCHANLIYKPFLNRSTTYPILQYWRLEWSSIKRRKKNS